MFRAGVLADRKIPARTQSVSAPGEKIYFFIFMLGKCFRINESGKVLSIHSPRAVKAGEVLLT